MRIIDRYLLRQFFSILAITFCSLTGLYVVIDAFSNLDEFVEYAPGHGGLLAVLVDYYAYRSLAFFDQMSGILALISAMFTVTWLARHNELTALLAAGIPKLRIVAPILIAASCISFLAAGLREAVIPRYRHKIARDAKDLAGTAANRLLPRYDYQTDILLGGETTVRGERRIVAPLFTLPRGLDLYGRQLSAVSAVYEEASAQHPAGYLLRGVVSPTGIRQAPSFKLGETPVVITPIDAKWLGDDQVFVVSQVDFDMLAGGAAWREYSSTRELVRGLAHSSSEFGADIRVAVHARFVQPFLDVTLLVLGLPLVLRRGRNVYVAIGLCVLVGAGFMLGVLIFQSLGSASWISPPLAAWAPLLIFAPMALALADPLKE